MGIAHYVGPSRFEENLERQEENTPPNPHLFLLIGFAAAVACVIAYANLRSPGYHDPYEDVMPYTLGVLVLICLWRANRDRRRAKVGK